MAHVYTPLPTGVQGELHLAKHLASLPDNRLHLWFGVRSLPSVPDLDIVLWHEAAGLFVIEVKAVYLRDIAYFGFHRCKINGRPEDAGPQDQAHRALFALKNYVGPFLDIFATSAACWPLIRRAEWDERWDEPRVTGEWAESMLFREDVYGDPAALEERLHYIRQHPTIGAASQASFTHSKKALEQFRRALDVTAWPKETVTDAERLQKLETRVRLDSVREVRAHSGAKHVYTGRPGTGKTFRLLQIAIHHAQAGCRVLYLCYNKVLAADVRRLLAYSQKVQSSFGEIDVYDAGQMVQLFPAPAEANTHPERVAAMRAVRDTLPQYDTILVDEGQDLGQWAYEMAELHSKPSTTYCIAAGAGQELYGEEAPWLAQVKAPGQSRLWQLNRVFRNSRSVFQLATLCFEAGFQVEKLERAFQHFRPRTAAVQRQIEFDRGPGALPQLVALDDRTPDDEWMTQEYARIINQEFSELGPDRLPMDLLILVPQATEHSPERRWAVQALERLGIEYLDYTIDANRRFVPQPHLVRLCTFHSSRGIEGHRVIVFGLERICQIYEAHGQHHKLGYIALSRASFELAIPYRSSRQTPALKFVQSALGVIRREGTG